MKIIFLNVWGEYMQDSLLSYLEEQARDTDIFCFQEATENMKRPCASVLGAYKELSFYKHLTEHENFPSATYVRNGLDIVTSGTLLQDDKDCGLALYVKVRTDDGEFYVCNAHGASRPVEKLDNPGRLKFSQELISFFARKNAPVVIGGDFYLSRETQSVKMFEEAGYRDLIKQFDIDTTRNHLAWDRFPVKMYYSDYVFLNDKMQLQHFSVPKNEISDHLPLQVEITITTSNALLDSIEDSATSPKEDELVVSTHVAI